MLWSGGGGPLAVGEKNEGKERKLKGGGETEENYI